MLRMAASINVRSCHYGRRSLSGTEFSETVISPSDEESNTMAGEKKRKASDDKLTDVARTIGSTLGNVAARAGQVLEGVKAAAEAGAKAYSGSGKKRKSKNAAGTRRKKTTQRRSRTSRASRKRSARKK